MWNAYSDFDWKLIREKTPGDFLLVGPRGNHVLLPLFQQNLDKPVRDHVAHQVITFLCEMQSIIPQLITYSLVQLCVGDLAVQVTGIARPM